MIALLLTWIASVSLVNPIEAAQASAASDAVAQAKAITDRAALDRPNILWITSEDNGPHLGSYGDSQARTPNLDALAARGMRFENAWSNAPVCAPARTTIITGVYASSLGAQHMRSRVPLPKGYSMFPQLLRQAGYYCSNRSKTDYNLTGYGQVWDQSNKRAHWRGRRPGQPFFSVFNFTTTHESATRRQPHQAVQDSATIQLPGYLPDLPEVRQGWAQYYDQMAVMDGQVGDVIQQLHNDGLADDTIIFYFGDHGPGFARAKRWPGNSGMQVPLIVYFPPRFRHLAPKGYAVAQGPNQSAVVQVGEGVASQELVGFVDLAPTLLSLAGAELPDYLQGRAFAGSKRADPPAYLHGFRDRMDERYDLCRSVRDQQYVYIRNYYPRLPHGQHLSYLFQTPTTQAWRQAFDQGKLSQEFTQFWLPRAKEELYDLQSDPFEHHNLANSDQHQAILLRMRQANRDHMARIQDLGLVPEAEMHRLAGDRSPRDWMPAELPESVQQYWRIQSFWQQPKAIGAADFQWLQDCLKHPSHSVVAAAAEVLASCKFEQADDLNAIRQQARARLLELADPRQQPFFASVAAWNAMQRIEGWTTSEVEAIASLPTQLDSIPKALSNYLPRLKERFVQTHEAPKKAGNNE